MQAGRNAMEATKEAAANLGASATAGMHKTRGAVQGQVDKATANQRDQVSAAEAEKQDANAAATGYDHPSQGAPGIDAAQGGGGAAPVGGHVEVGVGQTRPVGRATGTGRPSAAHNPHVGSDFAQGRGTGGKYQ